MKADEVQARAALKKQYGLTQVALSPLAATGGSFKGAWRAQVAGKTYALKAYRSDFRTAADVAALNDAQAHLLRRGLPVPAIIQPANPADGPFTWVLYEWVDGASPGPGQLSAQAAINLGTTVAQTVQHLAQWCTDWAGAEPWQAPPLEEQVALCEELLRHAEQGVTEYDRTAAEDLRRRIVALEQLAPLVPRILGLDRQWVHGDFHEGNLLYQGDRVVAIIDFDNMRRAPRAFDFTRALAHCFRKPGGGLLFSPEQDAFALAYLTQLAAPAEELELSAPLWAYTLLCDIWPLNARYLQPAKYDPSWGFDPFDPWWPQNHGRVTEWLLALKKMLVE